MKRLTLIVALFGATVGLTGICSPAQAQYYYEGGYSPYSTYVNPYSSFGNGYGYPVTNYGYRRHHARFNSRFANPYGYGYGYGYNNYRRSNGGRIAAEILDRIF